MAEKFDWLGATAAAGASCDEYVMTESELSDSA